jgi:hypothetical protein
MILCGVKPVHLITLYLRKKKLNTYASELDCWRAFGQMVTVAGGGGIWAIGRKGGMGANKEARQK